MRWFWCQDFKLCFDGGQVGLNQVVEQAGLIRAERLGTFGEAVTLELSDLVYELLVSGLLVQHFFIKHFDMLKQPRSKAAQLFGVEPIKRSSRNLRAIASA